MVGIAKKKGLSKWVAVLAIFALVSVATVLQTYSSLHIFRSISSPYLYHKRLMRSDTRNITTAAANPVMTSDKFTYTNEQFMTEYSISLSETTDVQTNRPKQKITHIGFLKVHKAGSTTMQNIFFRFGLKQNLTFVLPERGHYFLSTKSAMPVLPGHHRDILACHSKYSRKLFGSVLPDDTVNIGIIREPFDRMVSAAYYYRDVWRSPMLKHVPRLNFIHNLVNRPDLYELSPFTKTKNVMGQDFGFEPTVTINDTDVIRDHLDMLRKDFTLVLLMEKFDESLILMKRTLNWDLADIIYLKTNTHAHKPVILNQTELSKFKSTCFLDYAVFEVFNKTFFEKISAEGPNFMKEVEHFKAVIDLVKDYCGTKVDNNQSKPLDIAKSVWNEPFRVTRRDCYYMQMDEIPFVTFLKRRHRETNILNDLQTKKLSSHDVKSQTRSPKK